MLMPPTVFAKMKLLFQTNKLSKLNTLEYHLQVGNFFTLMGRYLIAHTFDVKLEIEAWKDTQNKNEYI